mgnify:CR=1 FL=1
MTYIYTVKTAEETTEFTYPKAVLGKLETIGIQGAKLKDFKDKKQAFFSTPEGARVRVTRRQNKSSTQGSATPDNPPRRNGKVQHPDDWVIRLLVDSNPKREGSKSHRLFQHYKDGMTVAEYISTEDCDRACLRYDEWKGFIRVEAPKQEAEQAE